MRINKNTQHRVTFSIQCRRPINNFETLRSARRKNPGTRIEKQKRWTERRKKIRGRINKFLKLLSKYLVVKYEGNLILNSLLLTREKSSKVELIGWILNNMREICKINDYVLRNCRYNSPYFTSNLSVVTFLCADLRCVPDVFWALFPPTDKGMMYTPVFSRKSPEN